MASTSKRKRKRERRKRNAERRASAIVEAPDASARSQVSLKGRSGDEQKVEFTFDGDAIPVDPERPVESLSERAEAIEAWERDGTPTSGTA